MREIWSLIYQQTTRELIYLHSHIRNMQSDEKDVEVVDTDTDTSLSGNEAALATYSLDRGPLTFKVLPVVGDTGTDWRLVVYSDGVQGPVHETRTAVTPEAAAELGISEETCQRLNDALAYADEHLSLSPELGDRQRDARRLDELEAAMGGESDG